mmetsp:Transcript_14236/g.23695  ORF Transcript_14236/g.23695 Transcript_14236/m.23695 type:complete len:450 (+) Transcript_14236:390-1739(+)
MKLFCISCLFLVVSSASGFRIKVPHDHIRITDSTVDKSNLPVLATQTATPDGLESTEIRPKPSQLRNIERNVGATFMPREAYAHEIGPTYLPELYDRSKYTIIPCSFQNLKDIVRLRVAVFYPGLKSDATFHRNLLDKLRRRFDRGSKCLVVLEPCLHGGAGSRQKRDARCYDVCSTKSPTKYYNPEDSDKSRTVTKTTHHQMAAPTTASVCTTDPIDIGMDIGIDKLLQHDECTISSVTTSSSCGSRQNYGEGRTSKRTGAPRSTCITEENIWTTNNTASPGNKTYSAHPSSRSLGQSTVLNPSSDISVQHKRPNNEQRGSKMRHFPVGTVEFNDFDFDGTAMASSGSLRKLYVADLAVDVSFRKRGIATALLAAVDEYAIEQMYDEIYMHVEIANAMAMNLYAKSGYKPYPYDHEAVEFTESHLQRPAEAYVMLYKKTEIGNRGGSC